MNEAMEKFDLRKGYKEVQFGPKTLVVPSDWSTNKFGDVFQRRRESIDEIEDETVKYVGLKHIDSGQLTIIGYEEDGRERSSSRIFREGDVLFGKLRPNLNKAAVAPFSGVCSSDIIPIYAEKDVHQQYLPYLMHSKLVRDRVVSTMEGTNLPRTSWDDLENTLIPLPSLPEQRRIADILSMVDEQIQQTDEIIEKRRELRQGLLQELFRRGAVEHERILAPEELAAKVGGVNTGMDHTTVGQIPEGWETERLGELTENSSYGINASAEEFDPEKPRYLRITDIADDGHLKQDDPKCISRHESEGFELHPGDLLFARTGATVGKTLLYQEDHPEAAYAGYLIRFQLNQTRILPKFAFYFTQTDNYDRWVSRITRQGAQENINTGEYCSILVPLPPVSEQQKIVSVLESVDQEIEQERQTKQTLKELKRGLMQDLLTGEVRIDTE